MIQDLFEVLSPKEREIFVLRNREKKTLKETAALLNCSINTVKEYCKRIKNKINNLEACNISIVYDNSSLPGMIEDIYREETARTTAKKTVNQVQFLAQCTQMSCKKGSPKTSAERKMCSRTGIGKKITKRKLTEEERAQLEERLVPVPRPERNITLAYMQYCDDYGITSDIEKMASLEIILRAAGLIYRTPYINKLNRKTSMQLRSQKCGYETIVVTPTENHVIPHGSKLVESIKDENGHTEYSTWLIPSEFVCKKIKQKRDVI